jgi:hypothetical protein
MSDKTHVALDENNQIVLFGTEEACFDVVQTHNLELQEKLEAGEELDDNEGDWTLYPAAIWVSQVPVGDGEFVGIYRHLQGDYLFGIDCSFLEQECEDGLAFNSIDGDQVFLLDSMDPDPDGTMKTPH